LGLIAGDTQINCPKDEKNDVLNNVISLVKHDRFNLQELEKIAYNLKKESGDNEYKKTILIIGEPLVFFNNYLSGSIFKIIEEFGYKPIYAPLSECMWLTWFDYIKQPNGDFKQQRNLLNLFRKTFEKISILLGKKSPFVDNLDNLISIADEKLGYYSGAFGRYRLSKAYDVPKNCQGVITVASTYENTEVALGVLYKVQPPQKPILNLTVDGTESEKNIKLLEAFLHYL
jgi:hypothetical protein